MRCNELGSRTWHPTNGGDSAVRQLHRKVDLVAYALEEGIVNQDLARVEADGNLDLVRTLSGSIEVMTGRLRRGIEANGVVPLLKPLKGSLETILVTKQSSVRVHGKVEYIGFSRRRVMTAALRVGRWR